MKERKRSKPTDGGATNASIASDADDSVYVLPQHFAIIGQALAALVGRLRMAMDYNAAPSGLEAVMPEFLSHHLDAIQRVLSRLPLRVAGLVSENTSGGESDTAQVYLAVGRLEEALSGWVYGYQEVKASLAQPDFGEVRKLLLGVYRHHLLEVCDWLDSLVEIINDPASAMERLKLKMGERSTLTFSLSVTIASEMDELMAIAKQINTDGSSELESTSAKTSGHSGSGLLGTLGALAFGMGITSAALGPSSNTS